MRGNGDKGGVRGKGDKAEVRGGRGRREQQTDRTHTHVYVIY